jgi:hypothetical protein
MYHVYRPVFAVRLAARELNRECIWGELSRALLGPYGENRGGFAEFPCTCTRLPASIVVGSVNIAALHRCQSLMEVGPCDTPLTRLWKQFDYPWDTQKFIFSIGQGSLSSPIICMSSSRCLRLCTTSSPSPFKVPAPSR